MADDSAAGLGRRGFLSLAAGSGVALGLPAAATPAVAQDDRRSGPATVPIQLEEHETDPAVEGPVETIERVGSDFMVDVIKQLKIEFVAATCGSSFRSLQESVTVYGNNAAPE